MKSLKIIIAPDSFKESLSAPEVCEAVEAGFRKAFPQAAYTHLPIADGGEGTVQSVVDATNGTIISINVKGPLGKNVAAFYGLTGDGKTAIIEMAAASGLHLVQRDKRNPLITSTYGTGQLIKDALDQGVERIVLGLGGSATNDGGAGMAQALGAKLVDQTNKELSPGGQALCELAAIDVSDLDPRLKNVQIEAACDVTNPLTGKSGASAVFGPQKGATKEMIDELDHSLARYAEVIEKELGKTVTHISGAGAAGGLGAGIVAFLEGELRSGIDLVLDVIQFEGRIAGADLLLTGEGRLDAQTVHGKAPVGVAKRAKASNHHLPVIAIAGSVGEDYEAVFDHGIDAVFSVVNGVMTLEEALENGAVNVEKTLENIGRLVKVSRMMEW